MSQNLVHATIAAGITGIPFAAAMSVGYAYMLDLVPPERTAEFVGIHTVSLSAAMVFGGVIAGKLIDMLGYRSIFPVAVACIIVGVIILQFVQARRVPGISSES